MAPAPKAKYQRRLSHGGKSITDGNDGKSSEDIKIGEDEVRENGDTRKKDVKSAAETGHARDRSGSPMTSTLLLRRSSAGPDGRLDNVPVRASFDDIKQHLKHLGPSNRASNPKTTRSTTVKIKPGIVVHDLPQSASVAEETIPEVPNDEGEDDNETTSLLRGKIIPKDGAHAVAQTYGTTSIGSLPRSGENTPLITKTVDPTAQEDQATQTSAHASRTDLTVMAAEPSPQKARSHRSSSGSEMSPIDASSPFASASRRSLLARSGSITEQVVETRGIKKTVLETTSSNDEDDEQRHQRMASRSNLSLPSTGILSPVPGDEEETSPGASNGSPSPGEPAGSSTANAGNQNGGGNGGSKKKNRRKKRKGKS